MRRNALIMLRLAAIGIVVLQSVSPSSHQAKNTTGRALQATPAKGTEQIQSPGSDIPKRFAVPLDDFDYLKREVMIPMRDGVKLHTVIIVPKGAKNAPILLTRTPYDASHRVARNNSPHMFASLPEGDAVFVTDSGYIRVQHYRFVLPTANHVFLSGHRIMIQIQSSWFPLYDRNPQSYVANIFFAKPADYVKATQSVFRSGDRSSAVLLPLVE